MKLLILIALLIAVLSNVGCALNEPVNNCTEDFLNSHLHNLEMVCQEEK